MFLDGLAAGLMPGFGGALKKSFREENCASWRETLNYFRNCMCSIVAKVGPIMTGIASIILGEIDKSLWTVNS